MSISESDFNMKTNSASPYTDTYVENPEGNMQSSCISSGHSFLYLRRLHSSALDFFDFVLSMRHSTTSEKQIKNEPTASEQR